MLFLKTEAGRAEVHARRFSLTAAQRQVLILCDGERHQEDLAEMLPEDTLNSALRSLVAMRLLAWRDVPRPPRAEPAPLTEAERFRSIVDLATSMALDLGFTSRIKAQLQIEKAGSVRDLTGVVDLLVRNLADHGKKTPLLALRLHKLKQLAAAQPA